MAGIMRADRRSLGLQPLRRIERGQRRCPDSRCSGRDCRRSRSAPPARSGRDCRAGIPVSVVSIPGVQKPHCRPWLSRNASCSGCSLSADGAMPSTVRMLVAVRLHRQHQAGARRAAVEQDGAGAADAVLAAEMGAGQAELVAQEIGERHPHFDLFLVALAVDGQRDFSRLAHGGSWRGRLQLRCPAVARSLQRRRGPRYCTVISAPCGRPLGSSARARQHAARSRCWR